VTKSDWPCKPHAIYELQYRRRLGHGGFGLAKRDGFPVFEKRLVLEVTKDPSTHISVHGRGTLDWRRPLYGDYYGLSESPFDLTLNPRFLFLSPLRREVLSNLRYALVTSKGLTVVLGDAGTGKTTLVRLALAEIGDTTSRYILICNPSLRRAEFYEFLSREFGLTAEAGRSKAAFLSELQSEVEARFASGGLTGLIVDEAQSMSNDLLEEIRLLGNIETSTTKLLNIVLCGQPELAARLNDPSLRQLKQRIALRCELSHLSLEETLAYVAGRLRIAAGSPAEIFTREAVEAIHDASGGIPRTINVLCDNALITGFAAQVKPIPYSIVEQVCRDFDFGSVTAPEPTTIPVSPKEPNAPGVDAQSECR
jgi:type II secretory pathway predicted ATPase ExeA